MRRPQAHEPVVFYRRGGSFTDAVEATYQAQLAADEGNRIDRKSALEPGKGLDRSANVPIGRETA